MLYAKILDSTMRKSWEEAVKNGVFRLDNTCKPIKVSLTKLTNEDQIEWKYNPNTTLFKNIGTLSTMADNYNKSKSN